MGTLVTADAVVPVLAAFGGLGFPNTHTPATSASNN